MPAPPIRPDEEERLAQLHAYHILDSETEQDFDDLVELASVICEVPIALISLVDRDRQWFKSEKGTTETGTGKDISFCAHTVFSGAELIIQDTRQDKRFKDNPLVTGAPNIVFYAGIPLTNASGYTLGSLCVIDHKARQISAKQRAALKIVARQVMEKIELRKQVMDIEEAGRQIEKLNHELVLSEEKSSYMIRSAPVAIGVLTGSNMIVESANDQLLEIWGKDSSVIGLTLDRALPELDGQPFHELLEQVYSSGVPCYGTETKASLVRNGELGACYFNFVYQPLKDGLGQTRSIMVVANEVTEQVSLRERIQFNEHRTDRMVMTAPMGMTILRGTELLVEIANEPMLKIWKRTADEIVGKKLLDVFPELIGQPFPGIIAGIFESGKAVSIKEIAVDIADIHGNMEQIYVDFSYEPLSDPDGKIGAIMATVKDITEIVKTRKQLEENEILLQELNEELTAANEEQEAANEELLSSYDQVDQLRNELEVNENRLRMATDIVLLATVDIDLLSGSLICSQRYAEIFGFDRPSEVTLPDFFKLIDPDDYLGEVIPAMEIGYKTGEFGYDARLRIPDKPLKWIRVKGKMLFSPHGEPVRIMSTAVDITEKMADEQRKHDFIAIVSHELKTPLTSAKAYIQLSARQMRKHQVNEIPEMLDKTLGQLDKMENMVRGFLDVSRLESGKLHLDLQKFDLVELIGELIAEHQQLVKTHQFDFRPSAEAIVFADRNKLMQVAENLIANAIKYAPLSKRIDIICKRTEKEISVSVRDYGPGIKEEDLEKLFERFYRVNNGTKGIVGFGIGLYLCSEIIKRHSGELSVTSEYGKGSTFCFSLPLVQPNA